MQRTGNSKATTTYSFEKNVAMVTVFYKPKIWPDKGIKTCFKRNTTFDLGIYFFTSFNKGIKIDLYTYTFKMSLEKYKSTYNWDFVRKSAL